MNLNTSMFALPFSAAEGAPSVKRSFWPPPRRAVCELYREQVALELGRGQNSAGSARPDTLARSETIEIPDRIALNQECYRTVDVAERRHRPSNTINCKVIALHNADIRIPREEVLAKHSALPEIGR